MKQNKTRFLPPLIVVIFIVGGVLAYFTQSILVHNDYSTPAYDTKIEEDFHAPDNWLPGQNVNKDVWIENYSSIPIYAKVILKQKWVRTENIQDQNGNPRLPLKGESLPLTFLSNGKKQYAAQIKWSDKVVLLNRNLGVKANSDSIKVYEDKSEEHKNGIHTELLPVVDDPSEAEGKWLLMNDTPDSNGEIVAYYIGSIKEGKKSPRLVDSVTMNPLIESSIIRKDTRFDKTEGKWTTVETGNMSESYEAARYTLTIVAETVQATESAAAECFGDENRDVIKELEKYNISSKEVKPKRLTFEKKNGKMVWSKRDESGQNLFMQFENMIPGQIVTDYAIIKNKSNKKYDLYLKIIPIEQSKQLDELLELISMKVIFEGKTIYDGSAAGIDYNNGSWNLRKAVKLCMMNPHDESKIKVILSLDKDTTIEYADILTKIDWQFMVKEINSPEGYQPITSDRMNILQILLVMLLTLLVIGLTLAYRRKKSHR